MAILILRGGGEIGDVNVGVETIKRARENGDEWIRMTWQPPYTPHRPDAYTLDVLVQEVVGVKVAGR